MVKMKWFMVVAWIIWGTSPATADRATEKLTDNPAFCFGLLTTQSKQQADALSNRKSEIRALFAQQGPKDSTDERSFDDWERVGRETASHRDDKSHADVFVNCRRLLDIGPN